MPEGPRQTLEELLDAARTRVRRYEPAQACAALEGGAVLIDIRSETTRALEGIVPGSLHIPRTVLEWRLEPNSDWRNPHVAGLEQEVILICDHGYSSLLAAATLVGLGFANAGDVIGGFAAWRDAGLATAPAPERRPAEPIGMSPPDL